MIDVQNRLTVVTDLDTGIAAITGAQHLVLGHSSFSEQLSMMAPDLQAIYFPFCSVREDLYPDLRSRGWGVPGLCYEYDGYIQQGEWQNTPEQIRLMTSFSLDKVRAFSLPVS